jgi:hypothetical protein
MRLYAAAYLRKYFTATLRSFGHVALMVRASPVTGWGELPSSRAILRPPPPACHHASILG